MNQASKLFISLALFVLFSGMIVSCSKCGKPAGPEAQQPETQAGATAPAVATTPAPQPTVPPQEGTGKKLTPEEFYNLMFERQEISLDFQKKRLDILKQYGSYTEEARKELMTVNNDTAQAQRAVMDKYGINYIDLRNAMQDQEMQKANNEYMKAHPEIQEKFKQNRERQMELSKELQPYEEKAREEMRQQAPAAPAPAPAPATKPAQ
ncbi:MAG: hypothetical protein A2V67_00070 [Deltaproteobacteria bacterium RBG_13_61_14]|nr:MAG: hypothetical protein A2V67_00070 [Deltaproteobacteria bacterium RBG_13_61_14]